MALQLIEPQIDTIRKRRLARWTLGFLGLALAGLLGLFTYSRWEVSRIEARYPPIGSQLQLDGFQLHYIDEGSGPTVVLLHGSTTTLRDFAASIFGPLSRHCRVVAFDRPGHGYSNYPGQFWMNPREQAAAVHDALRKMGIEQSIWVGHSWAGSVVMAGLLHFPNTVTGGVLLGGAAYPWQGGVDWSNHIADMPIVGPLFTRTALVPFGRLRMEGAIAAAFSPNRPPADYRRRTGIDLVLRPSQFIVNGRDVRLLSDFLEEQSKRYGAIDQPLLLIHGRDDDIVPAWNHADRLVRLLPQAVFHELPDTGHAPHHAHANKVARLIRDFASGLLE
jgi:pimeloyl-ACP methyl ester carboxylesterase